MNQETKQAKPTSKELQWLKNQIIEQMILASASRSLESKTKVKTYQEVMELIDQASTQS